MESQELKRWNKILQTVNSLVRPPIDAEDITTELWIREFEQHRSVPNLEIKNLCIDRIRKLENEKLRVIKRGEEQKLVDLSEPVLDFEWLQNVLKDNAVLTPREKGWIFERFYLGRTFKDIGMIEGIHPEFIRLEVKNILKKLKTSYERKHQQ